MLVQKVKQCLSLLVNTIWRVVIPVDDICVVLVE